MGVFLQRRVSVIDLLDSSSGSLTSTQVTQNVLYTASQSGVHSCSLLECNRISVFLTRETNGERKFPTPITRHPN